MLAWVVQYGFAEFHVLRRVPRAINNSMPGTKQPASLLYATVLLVVLHAPLIPVVVYTYSAVAGICER